MNPIDVFVVTAFKFFFRNSIFNKAEVQGNSSFTSRTINPIKKLVKIMKTLELHFLDIRLPTCAINFPLSLHSEP
jgi:hypothetical protein